MNRITKKRQELVITVSDNFRATYVKMEEDSAIIQDLTPFNYAILQEKLSTDSLRAIA